MEQRSIVLTALIAAIFLSGGAFYYFSRLNNDNQAPTKIEITTTPESAELAAQVQENESADIAAIEEPAQEEQAAKDTSETASVEEATPATEANQAQSPEENTTPIQPEEQSTNQEIASVGDSAEDGRVLAAQDVAPTASTGPSHLFLFATVIALLLSMNTIVSLSRNY
jgi:cell division protein FtsN